MRFSLSRLADYVDLGEGPELETEPAGRHSTLRITEAAQRKASQIGEKLTSVGLAVEGYPVQTFDGGGRAASGAGEPGLEVEVTSNWPDCMCHLGLARELAVALESTLRPPSIPLYGSLSSDGSSGAVVLEDPEGCPRYVARVIRGLKVGPSPEWLKRRQKDAVDPIVSEDLCSPAALPAGLLDGLYLSRNVFPAKRGRSLL